MILPRLKDELGKLALRSEILVIDTMTKMDDTEGACIAGGARYCVRTGGNDYGCAVRTGIALACGDYVICMDADGSHSPEFIKDLYESRGKADVVIASRYVKGGGTENSFMLILMSRIVNVVYSLLLGLPCRDVSNSFKLYRRADLQSLCLTSKNFDIVEEILFKLKKTKGRLTILEIPYFFKERQFGQTKRNLVLFIISYLGTLLRLRFGK